MAGNLSSLRLTKSKNVLDLNFQGFAISIISKEVPEKLVAEAGFTLNKVNDVERFLK